MLVGKVTRTASNLRRLRHDGTTSALMGYGAARNPGDPQEGQGPKLWQGGKVTLGVGLSNVSGSIIASYVNLLGSFPVLGSGGLASARKGGCQTLEPELTAKCRSSSIGAPVPSTEAPPGDGLRWPTFPYAICWSS